MKYQLIISKKKMNKKWLHGLGSVLSLLAIIFVILRLRTYNASLDFSKINLANWLILIVLAFVYCLANSLQAVTWRNLLKQFGAPVSQAWALKIHGISQLAKYIPGNIFHFAGRQAMGLADGINGRALAKSTFWELGLSAIVAIFFALLALPLKFSQLPIYISLLVFTGVILTCSISLRLLISVSFSKAIIYETFYLILSGLVFVKVLSISTQSFVTDSNFSMICGAYILAWLIGMLTPGAPAGIGVREFILLFLFKGMVVEADLLLAIILGRIICVGGDILYFFFSLCIPKSRTIV